MHRATACVVAVVVAGLLYAAPTWAQTGVTIRTLRIAPVLETPRGDSMVVGTIPAGTVLAVLERQIDWFRVDPPAESGATWRRGWIYAGDVEVVSGTPGAPAPAPPPVVATPERPATPDRPAAPTKPAVPDQPAVPDRPASPVRPASPQRPASPDGITSPGRMRFRGFVQAGGAMFAARDSFETILDSSFGPVYGGGGQVSFPNGVFVQAGVSRFKKTGTRAIVSASQVFRLDVPHTVTLTPIEFTGGYRVAHTRRIASYVGIGAGWYRFEEATPSLTDDAASSGHPGFHLLAGAEYSLGPWLSLAGEAQWAKVPKVLGSSGVSVVFEENDLGAATFRFKILVGR